MTISVHSLDKNDDLTVKNFLMRLLKKVINVFVPAQMLMTFVEAFISAKSNISQIIIIKRVAKLAVDECGEVVDFNKIKIKTWKRFTIMMLIVGCILMLHNYFHPHFQRPILIPFIRAVPIVIFNVNLLRFIFYVETVNFLLERLHKIINEQFTISLDRVGTIRAQLVFKKSQLWIDESIIKLQAVRKMYNMLIIISEHINASGVSLGFAVFNLIMLLTCSMYEMFILMMEEHHLSNFAGP